MPDVARSIIVSGGIGAASPFTEGYIAVIGSASPPEVASTFIRVVNDGFRDGLAFEGGGYISDDGGVQGIEMRSESPDGGGVYLIDESSVGIYILDQSVDSSGIYIISGDNGSSGGFAGGVFIRQEAEDSVGIYIEELSSGSAFSELLLSTVDAPIILEANGSRGRIILDSSQVVRFGTEATTTPIAEVGALGFVFGGLYDDADAFMQAGGDALSLDGFTSLGVAAGGRVRVGRVNGTLAAPSGVLVNEELIRLSMYGYTNAGAFAEGPYLTGFARNTWTAASRPAGWELYVTRSGATVPTRAMRVDENGFWLLDPSTNPNGTLTVDGNTVNGIALSLRNQVSAPGAAAGTLTNAPTAGDPAHWLQIWINGTLHKIPAWT